MPWSATFLAALASPATRVALTVSRIPVSWGPGTVTTSATSTPGLGVQGIGTGAPLAMSSQSVSVPSWSTSQGSARVALSSVDAGKWAGTGLPRGSVIQIGARAAGMSTAAPIFVGQLRDLQGVGPQTILSAWDFISTIATRTEWFSGLASGALFYHCDPDSIKTRTLSAAYTVGDTSLTLNTTADFGKSSTHEGAVLITPTSGAAPFVLTFTGQSTNTVTGVSNTHGWGAAASNAGIGSTVQEVAWMVGHPLDIAQRILTSTGTGANGSTDVYPAAWGLELPAAFVDAVGIAQWVARTNPSSGTHSVRVVSLTPQTAGQWLADTLAAYGMWLTMRQGEITGRGCIDLSRTATAFVMSLSRDNILRGLPSRSVYDTGSAVEYARTVTRYGTAGPTDIASPLTIPETVPAVADFVTDYGDAIYQNATAIGNALNQRIGAWVQQIPHAIDLVCRLEAAQLCPGDWVRVDHFGIWLPSATTPGPFSAMVGDVSVDWSAGAVTLRLFVPPT